MLKVKVSHTIHHVLGGRWHRKSKPSPPADHATTGVRSYDTKGPLPAIRHSLVPSNKESATVGRKGLSSLPYSAAQKRPNIWDYRQRKAGYG